MRLHRFLIKEKIGDAREIVITDGELINQWKNVFRFTTGTQLLLFDDTGFEYLALVARLNYTEARLRILKKEDKSRVSLGRSPVTGEAGREVCLFAALIKKNNFEWIVEKATELGVSQIVPIISDRSEKKGLNMNRAEKIIKEASEQSGRVKLTRLNEPQTLEDLLKTIEVRHEKKIKIFSIHPMGEAWSDKEDLGSEIEVFIGPEGGLDGKGIGALSLKTYSYI